ncbi:amidase signature domain-containing protein [Rhodocollybia butyracea]|uniref:Amidase signature domain-containing protein n=1 Tax=Rhodocollybia butyracea TaxID=206335 RepID=A0A9P5PEL9_9AGAR|nr:amidase signature domain-containing protein [Rhodocollybia butyracea]
MSSSFQQDLPDLYEAGVVELQDGLDAGRFSAVISSRLISLELRSNLQGPELRALLKVSPVALKSAAELDEERRVSGKRSMLHGIPVLLKDNIATISPQHDCRLLCATWISTPDDAGVVKRLRKAGAIILGEQSQYVELAHFRGEVPSGCGSSSGSGVAASIGLATVTLGTETNGSITSPTSNNNIVGVKPTVGLTSRAGVIPIAAAQDTVGPMTRSVEDAAIVLSVIAAKIQRPPHAVQPSPVPDLHQSPGHQRLTGQAYRRARSSFP